MVIFLTLCFTVLHVEQVGSSLVLTNLNIHAWSCLTGNNVLLGSSPLPPGKRSLCYNSVVSSMTGTYITLLFSD